MRKVPSGQLVPVIALLVLLVGGPAAFAQSAVDQYSEGIPTARGQKPTHDAATGGAATGGEGAAVISPQTRAELQKSKAGAAAEQAAGLSAPGGSNSSNGGETGSDSGMGLLLPLILIATLLGAAAIFVARRRAGATPG